MVQLNCSVGITENLDKLQMERETAEYQIIKDQHLHPATPIINPLSFWHNFPQTDH